MKEAHTSPNLRWHTNNKHHNLILHSLTTLIFKTHPFFCTTSTFIAQLSLPSVYYESLWKLCFENIEYLKTS